jgi:hypothetical protein
MPNFKELFPLQIGAAILLGTSLKTPAIGFHFLPL